MQYPEQERTRKILRYLYQRLQRQYARGAGGFPLIFVHKDKDYEYDHEVEGLIRKHKKEKAVRAVKAGVYTQHLSSVEPEDSILGELGLSTPMELVMLLARLERSAGYISLDWQLKDPTKAGWVIVRFLTEAGLREIGELPDPHTQFIEGLEAAIEAIRADDRLTEEEKQHKIDWLEEGKIIGRTLTAEAIKAIVAGIAV